MSTVISCKTFPAFTCYLQNEERSAGTVENYLRALRAFVSWQAGASVDKAAISRWKEHLLEDGYAPVTINAMLAAVHSYLHFRGWDQFRVHYLRVQRRLFRDEGRALSRSEYIRLVRNAYDSGSWGSSLKPSAAQASVSQNCRQSLLRQQCRDKRTFT